MSKVFPLQVVFEDSTAYILARVTNVNAALLTRAALSAITLRVYDANNPPETSAIDDAAVVAARTLVINTVVFDTLQTDSGWDTDQDADGFNVKIEVLPADIPSGSKKYRFETKFTNSTSQQWYFVAEVPTEGLYSS